NGIDLAIPAGQFVTVIGSNGAGKSTLLNVLTGDAPAVGGRVVIDDQEVTGWRPPRAADAVGSAGPSTAAATPTSAPACASWAWAWKTGSPTAWACSPAGSA